VLDAYFPAPPADDPPPPPKRDLSGIPARVSCILLDTVPDKSRDRLAYAVAGRGTLERVELPARPDLARSPAPEKPRIQAFRRCGKLRMDVQTRKALNVASAADEIADLRRPPRRSAGQTVADAMRQKDLEESLARYEEFWNRRHT